MQSGRLLRRIRQDRGHTRTAINSIISRRGGDFWFWAQFLRKSVKYRDTQLAINPFTCAYARSSNAGQYEEAFVSLSRS